MSDSAVRDRFADVDADRSFTFTFTLTLPLPLLDLLAAVVDSDAVLSTSLFLAVVRLSFPSFCNRFRFRFRLRFGFGCECKSVEDDEAFDAEILSWRFVEAAEARSFDKDDVCDQDEAVRTCFLFVLCDLFCERSRKCDSVCSLFCGAFPSSAVTSITATSPSPLTPSSSSLLIMRTLPLPPSLLLPPPPPLPLPPSFLRLPLPLSLAISLPLVLRSSLMGGLAPLTLWLLCERVDESGARDAVDR